MLYLPSAMHRETAANRATVPHHFVHDPTSCTLSQNSTFAFNLILLNHIDVCKPNYLIQYSEVILELSSNNKIYRNRAGGLVWRSERSGREFNYLFASCNCSSSVVIIASPLVSFECSMTVKSCYSVYLIVSDRLRKCDRTKRTRFSIYRSYYHQLTASHQL